MPSWTMFAQRRHPDARGAELFHFGPRGWAALGQGAGVVEVDLTEDPNGEWWAWMDAGDDTPLYISASYDELDDRFRAGDPDDPGPKVSQETGMGRVLRLRVQQLREVGKR